MSEITRIRAEAESVLAAVSNLQSTMYLAKERGDDVSVACYNAGTLQMLNNLIHEISERPRPATTSSADDDDTQSASGPTNRCT